MHLAHFIAAMFYNLALLGGTCYLINQGWAWEWIILALLCCASLSYNSKED
jgi:hypothetical protein